MQAPHDYFSRISSVILKKIEDKIKIEVKVEFNMRKTFLLFVFFIS